MNRIKPIVMIFCFMAASLACNLSARNSEKPVETIPVTTEAAGSLLDKVEAAEEQARSGGDVELVLTESEVTSMVALELQKQQPQIITNVQVHLRDGQVQLSGSYADSGMTLPLTIIAKPEVSEGGSFRIILVSAKLGPVSAPDVLTNQFQSFMDEQIADAITSQSGQQFTVTSVEIADGEIIIRGQVP